MNKQLIARVNFSEICFDINVDFWCCSAIELWACLLKYVCCTLNASFLMIEQTVVSRRS